MPLGQTCISLLKESLVLLRTRNFTLPQLSLDRTPSGSLELGRASPAVHASDVLMLPLWTNSWPLASHLVGHRSRVDMTYLEIVILAPSLWWISSDCCSCTCSAAKSDTCHAASAFAYAGAVQ